MGCKGGNEATGFASLPNSTAKWSSDLLSLAAAALAFYPLWSFFNIATASSQKEHRWTQHRTCNITSQCYTIFLGSPYYALPHMPPTASFPRAGKSLGMDLSMHLVRILATKPCPPSTLCNRLKTKMLETTLVAHPSRAHVATYRQQWEGWWETPRSGAGWACLAPLPGYPH